MKLRASLAGLFLAAMLPALAQEDAAPAPAAVACDDKAYHQFDFWLGDWEVTDTDGAVQGTNSITREEGGCLLLERWTSASGNTGQSYNFYNPVTETWRQVWVSRGAIIDYEGGLTETGSMKLTGTISPRAGGEAAPFTGEWTANEDGSVTQHFEQYDAQTETWTVWFTGIYRKAESGGGSDQL